MSRVILKNSLFSGVCKNVQRKGYCSTNNLDLKEVLRQKIGEHQQLVANIRKTYGNRKLGDATVSMAYGGMRGLISIVYETSLLDPQRGIRFRGYSIPDIQKKLPRIEGSGQPTPEGIFWLLVTGDIPTKEQAVWVSKQWEERSTVPDYTMSLVKYFPKDMHPMIKLSCAIASMSHDSLFDKEYNHGMKKSQYWESTYEDAMNLLGRITKIAAFVYRHSYGKSDLSSLTYSKGKDWGASFADMLALKDKRFVEALRLYLTIHCDHEGGNVSAHTSHVVSSGLSNVYLSLSAGINGLAGPLHGLANQQTLQFIGKMQRDIGTSPSDEEVSDYLKKLLASGRVIPGYGHAVLRVTDPRFEVALQFAEENLKQNELYRLIAQIYKIAPGILKATGKVKNPFPNVDAGSGLLLHPFGLVEMEYYTVLFAVSRALGILANIIWSRAMGLPIERPKSITSKGILKRMREEDEKQG